MAEIGLPKVGWLEWKPLGMGEWAESSSDLSRDENLPFSETITPPHPGAVFESKDFLDLTSYEQELFDEGMSWEYFGNCMNGSMEKM